ncbi:hypothetical protein HK104_008313 [Borealophlyctis nickersoniae]|nr:hypothetical protein HK104_008313 [Borealophlyctis nickersoniae]
MSSPTKVGFQGHKGAYSEGAALELFSTQPCFAFNGLTTLGFDSFDQLFEAVKNGSVDYGIIPIENSSVGTFYANYDLLRQHDLSIVGEYEYHEKHCLLALPGVKLEDLTEIRSHPYAIDQCRRFLTSTGPKRTVAQATDTAGSAADIKAKGLKTAAAIAGARAAKLYDLAILQSGIEDDANTVTRYVLIKPAPLATPPERHLEPRTSVCVLVQNRVGAFHKVVAAFALRDINIHKLESRPSTRSIQKSKPWEYFLYIDVDGSTSDPPVANALTNLKEFATEVAVLGSYPRYRPPPETPMGPVGIGM